MNASIRNALLFVLVLLIGSVFFLIRTSSSWPLSAWATAVAPGKVSLAILGDSDSHSYHDEVSFPLGHAQRGGHFHDITWQWGEVLASLRPQTLDLGPWGQWGVWWPLALIQDHLGLGGRAPAKQDFEFNFAQSGAGCRALIKGKMASRLLHVMDRDAPRWERGVVVIRIGINDFGTQEALQALSSNPQAPSVMQDMDECLVQIKQTVSLIHSHHPRVNMVLVGSFDNSNWARWTHLWRSRQALDNIALGLDHFDGALKSLVAQDRRLAFFDDRAWFKARWGGRDAQGEPAYRPVVLGGKYQVLNTEGDHPANAGISDGHAGLVWNLLWAQSLVSLIDQSFDQRIGDIGQAEVVAWLDRNTSGYWSR